MRRGTSPGHGLGKYFVIAVLIVLAIYALYSASKHDASNSTQYRAKRERTVDETSAAVDYSRIRQVCDIPRVYYYTGFISHEEADYIINLAGDKLERSLTVGVNGSAVVNPARTSYGYFFTREQNDPVLVRVEKKIADWTQLPRENMEAFNILRYEIDQEYKPHHDYFSGFDWIERHGNRIATVLIYLSNVEEGGETIFPSAKCTKTLSVKPSKGDAILFWDATPDGTPDVHSLHGSVPVRRGTKWSLTKWIRAKKYRSL